MISNASMVYLRVYLHSLFIFSLITFLFIKHIYSSDIFLASIRSLLSPTFQDIFLQILFLFSFYFVFLLKWKFCQLKKKQLHNCYPWCYSVKACFLCIFVTSRFIFIHNWYNTINMPVGLCLCIGYSRQNIWKSKKAKFSILSEKWIFFVNLKLNMFPSKFY